MPRRKSDGAESRENDATRDSTQGSPSPDQASDAHAPLPPAGAESAPDPLGAADQPADQPFEGGPVEDSRAPATETADTVAGDIARTGEAGAMAGPGGPGEFPKGPAYDEGLDGAEHDLAPPDLTAPAEPASPETEPPLLEPDPPRTWAETETETETEAETIETRTIEPRATDAEISRAETPRAEWGGSDAGTGAAVPPPPIPPATAHAESHEDEDEGGTSFAAWALGILLLLLAGAALGLWAGPKIAPSLPAGMKPVADWLAPGMADAEAELAVLRDDLDAIEGRVGALPSTGDLDARIGAAVAPVSDRLDSEIASVRQTLDRTGGADARQTVEALEAELRNQAAQLETLKTDFTGATGAASGDVNVFRADIDGLRAELAALRDQVSEQAARLDEVASSAEARVQAAEQQVAETEERAATALDTSEANAQQALIRAAVASGAPYGDAVTALEARGITVPPALAAGAATGIPTFASLREGFPAAAQAAIQASVLAGAGQGVLARAGAFVKAQVASRSLTPKPGPGTDAVQSRMEDKLRQDDLAGALAESDGLPSEAAAAMSGWLDSARLRLGAIDGLAALASSIPATN